MISGSLFAAHVFGLNQFIYFIFDDYFFGYTIKYLYLLYVVDILIIFLVIWLMKRAEKLANKLLMFWAVFNIVEALFDIFHFSYDPHFLFEEVFFLGLYIYLFRLSERSCAVSRRVSVSMP